MIVAVAMLVCLVAALVFLYFLSPLEELEPNAMGAASAVGFTVVLASLVTAAVLAGRPFPAWWGWVLSVLAVGMLAIPPLGGLRFTWRNNVLIGLFGLATGAMVGSLWA